MPARVPGYRGQIDQLQVTEASLPRDIAPLAQSAPTKDLSLEQMAAKAMHYLLHNPLPDHKYECRFDIRPTGAASCHVSGHSRSLHHLRRHGITHGLGVHLHARDERQPGGARGRGSHPQADLGLHPRRRPLLAASVCRHLRSQRPYAVRDVVDDRQGDRDLGRALRPQARSQRSREGAGSSSTACRALPVGTRAAPTIRAAWAAGATASG